MTGNLIERISLGMKPDYGVSLEIRIFRLICATTAVLCLGLVMPINLLQNLPIVVHVGNILLGLAAAFFYWESCRNRHFVGTFIVILISMLDVIWFYNGGSQGSVAYYYFPVSLFIVAIFRGRWRWIGSIGLVLNVIALFVVEVRFPDLVVPFQSASDRILDLETGVVCSCIALAAVTSVILSSHDREQRRISQIAAKLTASEQNYREIFNSTSDALFIHDATGGVLDVNERACVTFGASREALLRSSLDDLSLGQKPFSMIEATAKIGLAAAGKPQVFEWRSKRLDGGLFWSEVALRGCEIAGERRVIATVRDISKRKELEAQLLHSQRLEAVGTLASGVAHDLNNVLTPMLMASGILRETLKDPSDRELMTMLDSGGKRGAAIVKQLLVFSRNLAQDRVPVDPRQLMREMAQLMRSTLPKEIKVVANDGRDLGTVHADPTQLHQVLMNLCVNARDAMPSGGILTLEAEHVELPMSVPARDGVLPGGNYVVLKVADTGPGIPPEIMDRIFDPFFTTKGPGKGTGLGLASVHGIVKSHGGIVRVESVPGVGATFKVFLPAMTGATFAPFSTSTSPPQSAGRGECILVVDDDPTVLLATRRRLEREGYRVLSADGGVDALRIMKEAARDVRLVVTDFAMPGMDGPTLVPLLLKITPSLKVIGVSGNDHGARATELKRLGFAEVLSKPYESRELLQAIRRQLQSVT